MVEKKGLMQRRGWNEADVRINTPQTEKENPTLKHEELQKGQVIPLFFATDRNYLPFLSVALKSLRENSSKDYQYKVYVLHSGVPEDYKEMVLRQSEQDFEISFVDVSERLQTIKEFLHMRDYYTATTYFRIFIAGMFPQYDKALYLDSDTVILGDITELYSFDLGDNLLAGAPCEGVNSFQIYKDYVSKVDGLNPDYFFNAGVVLMNLKAFREENFYEQFSDLLKKYKFTVIQDEDYLNVLCQDRVLQLPRAWNKTPVAPDYMAKEDLRLVHYIMSWKPWCYDDIPYQEYFWEYAEKTEFYPVIKAIKDAFDEKGVEKGKAQEASLKALAQSEIDREDGYFKVYGKRYGRIEK